MIDRRAPVLRHSWLGSLYRDGDQELIGSIELDPAIRAPRDNGDRDAEVLLEVSLDFDFGDLDLLVVRLDPAGNGEAVFLQA